MEIVIMVIAGFLLDCLIGDPRQIPHPIRFIGLLIDRGEKTLRAIFPKSKNGGNGRRHLSQPDRPRRFLFYPLFPAEGALSHPSVAWICGGNFLLLSDFCGQITEAGEHAGIWLR